MTAACEHRRRRSALAFLAAAVALGALSFASTNNGGPSPSLGNDDVANDASGDRHRRRLRLDPKSVELRSYLPIDDGGARARIRHPRLVQLERDGGAMADRAPRFTNEMGERNEVSSEEDLPSLKETGSCVPARAWHSFTPLNCNTFHEVDTGVRADGDGSIKFLDHGGRRDAWVYRRRRGGVGPGDDDGDDRVILKTLRWDKPYGERYFENQRDDALVSERLTASPHVIDVYGFCGMSTFNEFAGGGNFQTHLERHGDASPGDLLMYARNISIGLADVHDIGKHDHHLHDPPGMPKDAGTVVHHDFRHHNLLLTNDLRVKLSDFNTAQLMEWNAQEDASCGFRWFKHCGLTIWGADRSPEECTGDRQNVVTQKAEAFHLGALLHFLLSKKPHPYVGSVFWEGGERFYRIEGEGDKKYNEKQVAKEVRDLILRGVDPPLPREVLGSEEPAIRAILRARRGAMAYDADDRLTAREAADILAEAAADLGIAKKSPDPRRRNGPIVAAAKGAERAFLDPSDAREAPEAGDERPKGGEEGKNANDDRDGPKEKESEPKPFPQNEAESGGGRGNAERGGREEGGAAVEEVGGPGDGAPFPQNKRGFHKLEFVHIAKTGGTSIELAASRHGIAWGICKFEEYWSWETRCKPILPFRDNIRIQSPEDWKCGRKAWAWHCPPFDYENGPGKNKFNGVDTFTVVRNPYDLMVSEYYYLFQKKPHLVQDVIKTMKEGELDDPEFFNRWITDAAQRAIDQGHCYFAHCIAQHKFAYHDGERFVTHVLKMEELNEEFPKLMEKYDMPVELMHTNSRKGGTNLGVGEMSSETIEKINEWAGPDFEYFNYEKLDPSKAKY